MELDLSLGTAFELAIQLALSAALALLLGPLAILIARRLGAIDMPGSAAHKKHAVPTPLAGGLVLIIALPILVTIYHLWGNLSILWLLVASGVIFVFGILDDTKGFSAPQKLVGQLIASVIVIFSGTTIRFLENFHLGLPLSLIDIFDVLLTVFWLVGISNAFNLIDSMDGLVAGLATISSGFFTLLCLASGQPDFAQLAAILFGLSLGLYFYNSTPARFFLGDSGAQTLGFLLAVIGILYHPPHLPQGSTWFLPILVLGIPIFDTTLVVVSRLRRGKPVFQADLAHTYHRLVRLGMAPARAVFTIQITALFLCTLAFVAMLLMPELASLLFLCVLIVGIGLIVFFEKAVRIEP